MIKNITGKTESGYVPITEKGQQNMYDVDETVKKHRETIENWTDGTPVRSWVDEDGNLCVEYESGRWWHYNKMGEWW